MVKKLNADSAAREVIQAGQPVIDTHFRPTPDPRQAPPMQKPMPAPLAKALGQVDQS